MKKPVKTGAKSLLSKYTYCDLYIAFWSRQISWLIFLSFLLSQKRQQMGNKISMWKNIKYPRPKTEKQALLVKKFFKVDLNLTLCFQGRDAKISWRTKESSPGWLQFLFLFENQNQNFVTIQLKWYIDSLCFQLG